MADVTLHRSKSRDIGIIVIILLLSATVALTLITNLTTGPNGTTRETQSVSSAFTRTLEGIGGLPFLTVKGTEIVDPYGNIVVLRGVDFTGYEYIQPTMSIHPHFESDYATIASWGFNVVRLPISWENLEPRPGEYNDSYLKNLIDRDISWAKENHLYLILDMHQVCWSSHFSFCNGAFSTGIPNWAVSAYPNNETGEDAFLQDFFTGLGPNGTNPTSSNPSMESRFFAAWQHIASRYSNESAVAGFDILNEPPSTTPASFYSDAIDAIRAVDSNHICLWETEVDVNRSNVVYAPHYPQDSLTNYNATSLVVSMEQILHDSQDWNVPVFIGEWGMEADAPGVAQYIRDGLSIFDQYSVGAAWWDYASGGFTMDLFDANGNPRQVLVQNLVRPFISELTSPINQTSTFSTNNTSLIFDQTLNATAPIQVSISIPDGYMVVTIRSNPTNVVASQFIAPQRLLLITFPSAASTVTIEYARSV